MFRHGAVLHPDSVVDVRVLRAALVVYIILRISVGASSVFINFIPAFLCRLWLLTLAFLLFAAVIGGCGQKGQRGKTVPCVGSSRAVFSRTYYFNKVVLDRVVLLGPR